jgi:hypothetical protein
MFAKLKEDAGYDIPVEDRRTKNGEIPPYFRPRHLTGL